MMHSYFQAEIVGFANVLSGLWNVGCQNQSGAPCAVFRDKNTSAQVTERASGSPHFPAEEAWRWQYCAGPDSSVLPSYLLDVVRYRSKFIACMYLLRLPVQAFPCSDTPEDPWMVAERLQPACTVM